MGRRLLPPPPSIVMDAAQQVLQCGWAGCPKVFGSESEWLKHVAVHVFTLEPGKRVQWLGPPELDPDRELPAADGAFFANLCMVGYSTETFGSPTDDQSPGVDDGYNTENPRTVSRVNGSFSAASMLPQPEFPGFPDVSGNITNPSAPVITTVEHLRLSHSPDEPGRTVSPGSQSQANRGK